MKSHYSGYSWTAMAIVVPCFCLIILHSSYSAEGFSIEEATIPEIQLAFKAGNLTSRELLEFYLLQIETLNPQLSSVIEVNPDALLLADIADAQRLNSSETIESCLHGIPVLLKDNIASNDKLNTTAGSFALLGSKVPRDAGVVRKLREAGAIILGKASLSEWSHIRSPFAPNGWSARGGQVKNPYVLTADPCGSSAGPAVSVAANMAAVSLGTETDASILCPSGANAVVGIKPTVGLTSRAGVIPVTHRQDTVGPICRTVTDAVYLLDEIVGYDVLDENATKSAASFIPKGGYKQFLNQDGLRGKTLGIVRDPAFSESPGSIEAVTFENHLATLRQKGASLVENSDLNAILNTDVVNDEVMAMLYDLRTEMNIYLSELLQSPVRTLPDIIAFNDQNAEEEQMSEYGQAYFITSENTTIVNEEAYNEALQGFQNMTENGIEKVLKTYNLDALVAPKTIISSYLAVAGFPAISVPSGYSNSSVPFGICFGGGRGSEPTLIEIAYAFEQATKIRKVPTFISSSRIQVCGYKL